MHASGLAEAVIQRIPGAVTDRLPGSIADHLPNAAPRRRHRLFWLSGLGAAAYAVIRFGRPGLSWIRSKAGHGADPAEVPDRITEPARPLAATHPETPPTPVNPPASVKVGASPAALA